VNKGKSKEGKKRDPIKEKGPDRQMVLGKKAEDQSKVIKNPPIREAKLKKGKG